LVETMETKYNMFDNLIKYCCLGETAVTRELTIHDIQSLLQLRCVR